RLLGDDELFGGGAPPPGPFAAYRFVVPAFARRINPGGRTNLREQEQACGEQNQAQYTKTHGKTVVNRIFRVNVSHDCWTETTPSLPALRRRPYGRTENNKRPGGSKALCISSSKTPYAWCDS